MSNIEKLVIALMENPKTLTFHGKNYTYCNKSLTVADAEVGSFIMRGIENGKCYGTITHKTEVIGAFVMEDITEADMEYSEYMNDVNAHLNGIAFMTSSCLDWRYRGCYNDGFSAYDNALAALEANDYPVEEL